MRFFMPLLGLLIFFCAVPRRAGGGEVGFSVVGTGESAGDNGVGLLAGGDCRCSSSSPESSPARARSSSSRSAMLSEAARAAIQRLLPWITKVRVASQTVRTVTVTMALFPIQGLFSRWQKATRRKKCVREEEGLGEKFRTRPWVGRL